MVPFGDAVIATEDTVIGVEVMSAQASVLTFTAHWFSSMNSSVKNYSRLDRE